jgi:predicted Rossmann-fold nucleotide-binding protein
VGSSFWDGLVSWIEKVVQEEQRNISPEDTELFKVVDTAEEAVDVINKFYSKYLLSPNF